MFLIYLEQLEEIVMGQHQQAEEEQLENRLISYMFVEGPVMYRDKAYQDLAEMHQDLSRNIKMFLSIACLSLVAFILHCKAKLVVETEMPYNYTDILTD